MKTAIIACASLKRELTALLEELSCPYPVLWLEAGAHNHPHKRREEILSALDQCRDYDRVLLAMAYCGGALEGVTRGFSTLVLPRCDDCITLLLGSQDRRNRMKDSYFLSRGWLDGRENILNEYRRSLERYGQDRTNRIFGAMLKNYRYLAYIPAVHEDTEEIPAEIREFAENVGLETQIVAGTSPWLRDLVLGNHDPARYWIVSPGTAITREIGREKGAEP